MPNIKRTANGVLPPSRNRHPVYRLFNQLSVNKREMSLRLGMSKNKFYLSLRDPANHFTIHHFEIMSYLLSMPIEDLIRVCCVRPLEVSKNSKWYDSDDCVTRSNVDLFDCTKSKYYKEGDELVLGKDK
jgi:hypothetical protein